jgi:glycosyltransferase involved in cell wall biosynthesis
MIPTGLVADDGELFDLLVGGPVGVGDVELTDGLVTLRRTVGSPRSGRTLFVLARLHSQPIGCLALADDTEDPELDWTVATRTALAGSIDRHLLADGLDPASLDLWAGGAGLDDPPCLEERRRTLAAAKPVTVIIATRNRPEQLDACLDTVLALDYPAFDIVVVDNDPTTSDTADLVAARGRTTGKITYLRENRRGIGAARNRGLAAASGSIVAFTDDDVAVDRHWLSELAAPFVAEPGVAGATGLIMPAELETPAQLMLEVHRHYGKGFEARLYDLGPNRPDDVLFPFAAGKLGAGVNMAFDAAWLRGIGGFDAALGTGSPARGGEDLLALFQVVTSGRTLAYRPGALIRHYHHRDPAAVRRQVYDYAVGLGAYLTSVVVHEPRTLFSMMRRAPAGLVYLSGRGDGSGHSDGSGIRPDAWPRRLTRLERRGLLYGPLAYAISRARGRRPEAP